MRIINHIIKEETISGISPVKEKKGVHKNYLFFEVYTSGGTILIESQCYDPNDATSESTKTNFCKDHGLAVVAVANITREETHVYSSKVQEVQNLYNIITGNLRALLEAWKSGAGESERTTERETKLYGQLEQLRSLAIK
jgi:hypothetical protein